MTQLYHAIMVMLGLGCSLAFNVTTLTDSTGMNHNKFGHNIASYGEVVAVSNHPIKGSEAKVILFRDYEESVVIRNTNGKPNDFGHSMAMNNNSIFISSPIDALGGSVHIYDVHGMFVTQISGKDIAPSVKHDAEFGNSIAFLTDNLLLIGAKNNGPSGSGDVFVLNQIDANVWIPSGSFNVGSDEVNFGNHIAYNSLTGTIMISSLNNIYIFSHDQIEDIADHYSAGPIFVGPLDVIEFDYEVGNIVMKHDYAMVSLCNKESGRINWNYVIIFSIGEDHSIFSTQSINSDDYYTEKGNSLYISTQSNGDVVFMVGAESSTKSCVLVYSENTVFDDDGEYNFSSLCADTRGFGSSIAVSNNDVYIGHELYNGQGNAMGAVVVFQNYLYVQEYHPDENGGSITVKDEDDYTMHIEDAPAHKSSSSTKTSTKAITISMASLAFIAAIYCIYLAKYNSNNKHRLINSDNESLPSDKWNEKMHEQEALNIAKEIV